MKFYLLGDITSLITFIGAGALIVGLFLIREKLLKSKLGGIVQVISLSTRNLKITKYILFSLSVLTFFLTIFILITYNDKELTIRFSGQCIFWLALYSGSQLYSKLLICKDGFAGAGIPKTYWHEVKGVIWDRDIGQQEWGVKIFIHGLKRPYRAFFKREKKNEIESVIDEFVKQNST
jgi:hypothetical protein